MSFLCTTSCPSTIIIEGKLTSVKNYPRRLFLIGGSGVKIFMLGLPYVQKAYAISLLNRKDSFNIVRSSTQHRQGGILTSGKSFAK
jgi:hypothetical protein